MADETTLIYPALGEDRPFFDLVDAFYRGVENDPMLRPLYPTDCGCDFPRFNKLASSSYVSNRWQARPKMHIGSNRRLQDGD